MSVIEIFRGYVAPLEAKHAVTPRGYGGLNDIVRSLTFCDAVIQEMVKPRNWKLGNDFHHLVYRWVLQMARKHWATDFLGITDKATSHTPTGKRENLTVALAHNRFQNDPKLVDKGRENKLYKAFDTLCKTHKTREFRCGQLFHLDLDTVMQGPGARGGDIHVLTKAMVDWFVFVFRATHAGALPNYSTAGADEGRKFVRDLLRMMRADRKVMRQSHRNSMRKQSGVRRA